MITDRLRVSAEELEEGCGWRIEPRGACRDEECVPLPEGVVQGGLVDLPAFARRLGMPLVHDPEAGLWCLGPRGGGRALASARAPELVLPDWRGEEFRLSSLRGQKVLLLAWASW